MNSRATIFKIVRFWMILSMILFYRCFFSDIQIKNPQLITRLPRINPDYSETVIPHNIAPLNFLVQESGAYYYVKIYVDPAESIEIKGKAPAIRIPIKHWNKMLAQNRGKEIHFEIYVKDERGVWNQFQTITNQIANEAIDDYLVYRLSEPIYVRSRNMGIYQRNLTNYQVSTILHARTVQGCINCHSFYRNQPEKMLFHIRYGPAAGTLFVHGDTLVRVDTRTSFNKLPGAYRSWHPNGKLLAFSVNAVRQFFHATGEVREAADLTSDLILYQIDSNTVTTCPMISSPDRMETYPEWSPDGQYLYFCSTPQIAADVDISQQYQNIHYDLMRIRYQAENGTWGELETVLSAKQTGLSIAHPKISPDGRFLLFCMAEHGTFTLFRPGGDLYLMDLTTGHYNDLVNVNSPQPESYHSWSSNSRWFTFSSKRYNEICALVYFCYVDDNGKVYKPFLLPQKDPDCYDNSCKTYNVPELLQAPIKYRAQQLTQAAFNNRKAIQAEFDKEVAIEKTTREASSSFH